MTAVEANALLSELGRRFEIAPGTTSSMSDAADAATVMV